MTSDLLQASVAAALVQANLAFTTSIGKSGDEPIRVFQLQFGLRDKGACLVTGYSAGAVFMAVAPIRISDPSRWSDVSVFLTGRMPMVQLMPNAPVGPGDIAWVAAAIPAAPKGEPMPPWLAVSPFGSVAGAVDAVVAQFGGLVSPATDVIPPLFAAVPDPSTVPMDQTISFRIVGALHDDSKPIVTILHRGEGGHFGEYTIGYDEDGRLWVYRGSQWRVQVSPRELATIKDVVAEAEAKAQARP